MQLIVHYYIVICIFIDDLLNVYLTCLLVFLTLPVFVFLTMPVYPLLIHDHFYKYTILGKL